METSLLNNLKSVFHVTTLRIINQLDSWKMIFNNLCTSAGKKDTIRKIWKNLKIFGQKYLKKLKFLQKCGKKTALNWGIALFSAVYKPH